MKIKKIIKKINLSPDSMVALIPIQNILAMSQITFRLPCPILSWKALPFDEVFYSFVASFMFHDFFHFVFFLVVNDIWVGSRRRAFSKRLRRRMIVTKSIDVKNIMDLHRRGQF